MKASANALRRRPQIVKDPRIVGGEPVIAGTRVPVRSIVILHQSYQDIPSVYRALPTLPPDAVEVALGYYERHRAEIDRYIAESSDDGWTA